ncbi:unnamed protein product [Candida verbasci]|uniref:LicD/FKTN/FKRP nucleotidyltransferase domain-containing protein n=1 Tax=Candida verbasci TaxID=1227364 RepID=A0A9W4TYQ1_9ASCO|nr:unnamed protein product [Candida verbasci]
MPFTCSDIIKIIFAIILPPLGVFLERGCSSSFFLNIILTILGYIPGIIHAFPIIHSDDDLYPIPNLPYDKLTSVDKILYKLNEVTINKDGKYWLGHTELTDYEIEINVSEFLQENWVGQNLLFYDPRFTLSIYLSEIKNQYQQGNKEVVLPFSWSDWVDLTKLNEELAKPESQRKGCAYLKQTHHIPTKIKNYCIDNNQITDSDLKEMKLPNTNYVPGFAIRQSPTNKASNEVRMLEGKSHLLTYAKNPYSIIWLNKNGGTYEVKIDEKQKIVDSEMFNNYLKNNKIKPNQEKIVLNPVKEFRELLSAIKPKVSESDEFGMIEKLKSPNPTESRELFIPESAFNYQQDKIDSQIKEYDIRMAKLKDLTTNELNFDLSTIEQLKFTRNEKLYYESLKYANRFPLKKEQTYFRMARLNFGNEENDHDAGWHYEWRFFNGALRYLKTGWSNDELLIREKVLLDRILRNWFRFANEKGIISWIAHGPLLSWYWDGLLFPFDEDIDIQMPIEQLINFSKNYNQTLVIEDITEGFGKYFIECSTFIHHRGKSYKENHIDARFIDIDTGSYIDITGIGLSNEEAPERYNELIIQNESESKLPQVYNCRYPHFYSYEEIIPLRFTMMGGVPLYVPNQIETILKQEYVKGLTSYDYEGFYFIDKLNLWIHYSKIEFLFKKEDYLIDNNVNVEKFTSLVQNITNDDIVRILENDEDILLEYYLTKQVTDLHKIELTHMFNLPNGKDSRICDIHGMKSQQDISSNIEYHKLTSQFNFQKPFRRSLFNYEMIDRPRHHKH